MIKSYISILFFVVTFVNAQQSIFFTENKYQNITHKLGVDVYTQSFIKNNEYFNYIADGYTLLGTQFYPKLVYQPNNHIQFQLGLYTDKNFGNHRLNHVIPTFSFRYKENNHTFEFGNIDARDNHGMIEPLYAPEKILSEHLLETGLSYRFVNRYLKFKTWLDWENYIIKNDSSREVITAGISSEVNIINNQQNHLYLPIQFLIQHRGGQINNKKISDLGVTNLKNIALGIGYKKRLSSVSNLDFQYFYLDTSISENEKNYLYHKGNAHYTKLTFDIRNYAISLAYFKANKFNSIKGNVMFQTQSGRTDIYNDGRFSNYVEPNRELLNSQFNYKYHLTRTIQFGFQLDAYYQMNTSTFKNNVEKNLFDYSMSISLIMSLLE